MACTVGAGCWTPDGPIAPTATLIQPTGAATSITLPLGVTPAFTTTIDPDDPNVISLGPLWSPAFTSYVSTDAGTSPAPTSPARTIDQGPVATAWPTLPVDPFAPQTTTKLGPGFYKGTHNAYGAPTNADALLAKGFTPCPSQTSWLWNPAKWKGGPTALCGSGSLTQAKSGGSRMAMSLSPIVLGALLIGICVVILVVL